MAEKPMEGLYYCKIGKEGGGDREVGENAT
jgi:hypothetical protein